MSGYLFAKSFLLGLAVAAPLGPVGALCIGRTLERGFWAGMAGGLGTALADAAYALLAAFGFTVFAGLLAAIATPLALAGGLFLVWLGWKSLSPAPAGGTVLAGTEDLLRTMAATFLLTVANPMTILSFAAIFAGLGLAGSADGVSAVMVVAGVFLGSLAWWFLLSGAVALIRRRLPDGFVLWVARISGLVIIGFGLVAIGSALV
jgi:putative LysE/RhtB family amino acid efflux pump